MKKNNNRFDSNEVQITEGDNVKMIKIGHKIAEIHKEIVVSKDKKKDISDYKISAKREISPSEMCKFLKVKIKFKIVPIF